MVSLIIFLVVMLVVDVCAMEQPVSKSDPIALINNMQSDRGVTQATSCSDTSDSDQLSKKYVQFSIGSIQSSTSSDSLCSSRSSGSTDLLSKKASSKNSKLKKGISQEQKGWELLDAMKRNNTQEIMSLLHPNLNCADDEDGWTPLIIAIRNSNNNVVQDLLAHKQIDLNQADKLGNTPLHHAVFQKDVTIIITLLHDPRVYSLFRNEKKYMANEFINDQSPSQIFKLKSLFFVRGRLDALVDRELSSLKKEFKGNKGIINQIVDKIKKSVEEDGIKQESYQVIPKDIQLPTDAEFIKRMVIHRLAKHICTLQAVEKNTGVGMRSMKYSSIIKK